MKKLTDYINQIDQQDPCVGDPVGIETSFEDLIETYVVDVLEDGVVVESDQKMIHLLESCGCYFEDIQRYGPSAGNSSQGFTLEDQSAGVVAAKEIAADVTNPMPGVHEETEHEASPVERAILHRIMMQHPAMISRYGVEALMQAVQDVAEFVGDVDEIGSSDVSGWIKQVMRHLDREDIDETQVDPADQGEYDHEGDMAKDDLHTIIRAARRLNGMLDDEENMPEWVQSKINKAADYVDTAADYVESNKERDVNEAEYQGRKVPLGKPMRGDVKKFKVYVKDPSTGNIKKVNFGHGGTSAKRAGQKTMKIKKSNPARRKSFRARHNCDNPGPRTKARYWSCRAW